MVQDVERRDLVVVAKSSSVNLTVPKLAMSSVRSLNPAKRAVCHTTAEQENGAVITDP